MIYISKRSLWLLHVDWVGDRQRGREMSGGYCSILGKKQMEAWTRGWHGRWKSWLTTSSFRNLPHKCIQEVSGRA